MIPHCKGRLMTLDTWSTTSLSPYSGPAMRRTSRSSCSLRTAKDLRSRCAVKRIRFSGRHKSRAALLSIEGRETQFLERLAPPERYQTPSHFDERTLAFMHDNCVRWIGRTGIEARLKVWNRHRRRQAIERLDLLPGVVASEPSAHLENIAD